MPDAAPAIEVTEATFQDDVISRSYQIPVLVDFWAPWCGPCRTLMPVLDKVIASYGGKVALAKVNTDEQQTLAGAFGVRSLPTVKLFRNGTPVDEFMGVQPESAVRAMIEPHVERHSDQLRVEAAEARAAGDTDRAVQLLTDALNEDPDNLRIHPDFVELLLDVGNLEAAAAVLKLVPTGSAIDDQLEALRARLRLAEQSEESSGDGEALQAAVDNEPDNCEARFELASWLTARGDYENALDHLLEILRRNRTYKDGAARQAMLDVFQLLGNSGPLVSHYRAQLASTLH